eukprot:6174702-Pleurochrysis_carterae.AAC.1
MQTYNENLRQYHWLQKRACFVTTTVSSVRKRILISPSKNGMLPDSFSRELLREAWVWEIIVGGATRVNGCSVGRARAMGRAACWYYRLRGYGVCS